MGATAMTQAPLPTPLAMDDRYVVLTAHQWAEICVSRVRILPPFAVSFSEYFGRHVIVQDTIGM